MKNDNEFDFNPPNETGVVNWKCFLIGHSFEKEMNDSGYPICDRCNMHGFYDNEESLRDWPRMWDYPIWIPLQIRVTNLKWALQRKYNTAKKYLFGKEECFQCKVESPARKFIHGKCPNCGHIDDLPF